MKVEDLFFDLADGSKLVKLLEIVSGEKLGKNKMRVHRNKNVNKTRAFLRTKVRLENIGAEHIVDGIRRMLGLIWTIILRFRIQEIEVDDYVDDKKSNEKKSAKDALLLPCLCSRDIIISKTRFRPSRGM